MKALVFFENNQALTTSLKIAEVFEKQHKDILEKIRLLAAEISATTMLSETSRRLLNKWRQNAKTQNWGMLKCSSRQPIKQKRLRSIYSGNCATFPTDIIQNFSSRRL